MTLVLEHDSILDLAASLISIRAGVDDPTMRISSGEVWRASWTPEGPMTLRVQSHGEHLAVDVWGEGSAWGLDHAGALCGLDDHLDGFATDGNAALHRISSRHNGFRLPRSGNLPEALTWAVAAQQTSTYEAQRTYRQLVVAHGTRAPGPVELLVPPAPAVLAGLHAYDLHTFGFSQPAADLLRRIAAQTHQLERLSADGTTDVRRRLSTIDGLTDASIELVVLIAFGDADAVPTGDLRRAHEVGRTLAGEPHADDSRMLELLEPWRGHRGRVIRLIETAASRN